MQSKGQVNNNLIKFKKEKEFCILDTNEKITKDILLNIDFDSLDTITGPLIDDFYITGINDSINITDEIQNMHLTIKHKIFQEFQDILNKYYVPNNIYISFDINKYYCNCINIWILNSLRREHVGLPDTLKFNGKKTKNNHKFMLTFNTKKLLFYNYKTDVPIFKYLYEEFSKKKFIKIIYQIYNGINININNIDKIVQKKIYY